VGDITLSIENQISKYVVITILDLSDVDGQVVVSEHDVAVLIQRGTKGEWPNRGLVLEQDSLPIHVE